MRLVEVKCAKESPAGHREVDVGELVGRQTVLHLSSELERSPGEILVDDDVDRRHGYGTGQKIAGKCRAMSVMQIDRLEQAQNRVDQ